MNPLIVTGSDTGIGKTVVCAMLTLALDGIYWKPIQSGTDGGTDTHRVRALTDLPPSHFLPERYVLREPLSPHRAAELDGITIAPESLDLPQTAGNRRLIVEGAGGVLVPIDRQTLQIELFSRWRAPVLVVARTTLGTINHTLLTLEALQRRAIEVMGVIFVGDAMPDTERTIAEFGGLKILGRLPILPALDAGTLREAFATHFDRRDFELVHGG
ncbi:MAG: adenosylmethionine---8-amino-7-oxononanoate aminotransferase [Alphaproteobacteria bacterium]|jgi:dethiobiotin synthetase|nr:adenosylmethionine---8-amino-7-oxononanoate aminotransferase [Alphaproteobacteria bacterium]